MQVPAKHFPAMGILTLVLVGAAAGSIYYYQFALPREKTCANPVHRVIFLDATVQEADGFKIIGATTINSTSPPLPAAANYTASDPRLNFTDVKPFFANYTFSGRSISANVGDTITIYMTAVNSSNPAQFLPDPPARGLGHGFGVDGVSIPTPITLVSWGTWGSTSFVVNKPIETRYRCLHDCSPLHGSMTGSLVVSGCA